MEWDWRLGTRCAFVSLSVNETSAMVTNHYWGRDIAFEPENNPQKPQLDYFIPFNSRKSYLIQARKSCYHISSPQNLSSWKCTILPGKWSVVLRAMLIRQWLRERGSSYAFLRGHRSAHAVEPGTISAIYRKGFEWQMELLEKYNHISPLGSIRNLFLGAICPSICTKWNMHPMKRSINPT